jgi:predicted acylesterase/phospholipase RssA
MSTSSLMAGPAAGRVAGEPRTAFVLAGGAALGAMQAGMVHALYERDIVPDLLIGTSAGALNAAFLASRPATTATVHELAALWRGLRRRDILPLRPATLVSGLAGRRDHLIPDRALRRLAARHLQFERLEQAAIPLHLVAFDLLAGIEVRLSDGPLGDAVLAAAAIPGVGAVPASLATSAIGYYLAYRSIYAAEGGYKLSRRQLTAVVAAGRPDASGSQRTAVPGPR